MRPDARIGTELGGYQIEAILGRGGMGVVYRAEHLRLKRKVALKLLAPELADEEDFRARFLRESQLAAAIDHPNIIPIYEAGEVEGEFFLAMRYVEGVDLSSRLKQAPLGIDDTVVVLSQVASALDAAHAEGLVHRDVKPGNILIATGKGAESSDHVYLTDFGLTKRRDSRSGLTQAGAFLGSLDYIAPEQIEGKDVDGRADLYALGCMLYHCLTGSVPFAKDNDVAVINAHLRETPPSVRTGHPELPPELDRVIRKAMAKKPDDRYQTGRAFITALKQSLGRTPTETRPIPTSPMRQRVPLLLAAGLAIAAVLGLAAASLGLLGSTPSPSPSVALATSPPATVPSTAFPNAAEQALISRLPAAVGDDCQRTEPLVDTAGQPVFPGRPSVTSIECRVTVGEAIITLELFEFAFGGSVESELISTAGRLGLPVGDCATTARAFGRWPAGDAQRGDILCHQGGEPPRSRINWTYRQERLYARASTAHLDPPALYDWWQTVAPFVD